MAFYGIYNSFELQTFSYIASVGTSTRPRLSRFDGNGHVPAMGERKGGFLSGFKYEARTKPQFREGTFKKAG